MISKELKKRISELNRKDIKIFSLSEIDRLKNKPLKTEIDDELPEKFLNGEIISNESGCFLRILRNLRDLIRNSESFVMEYNFIFSKGGYSGSPDMLHSDMQKFLTIDSEEALFVDLETCGLNSSPIFLVGLMYYKDGDFVFEQLFARDYSEEKPLLSYLEALIKSFKILVTFNGKSFDYRYLMERGFLYNIRFDPDFPHLDLLHESRRRWKEYLPDCKLQTIERMILKRRRIDDIPGDEIPDAYHEFVRTGNIIKIKSILKHNLFDLLSMSELIFYMFTKNV